MRQITSDMCYAMEQRKEMKKANTAVEYGSTAMYAYLHGNLIAAVTSERLYLRSAGWESRTTKERLNGLLSWYGLPYRIIQGNYQWYLVPTGGDPIAWEKAYMDEPTEELKTYKRFIAFDLSTLKLIEP